jgi:iron(III) transport system ATP-binding protein
MADRIVVMNHGVIEQVGTPTEIYREPRSLFVADFIGETNQIHSTVTEPGQLALGGTRLRGQTGELAPGQKVIATIRPEDIVPHEPAFREAEDSDSLLEVTVGEMEFLGSFWRSRLTGPALDSEVLYADFSINAVRRLSIDEGKSLTIELPPSRLIAFAAGESAGENHGEHG